jgi:hypothetical protein
LRQFFRFNVPLTLCGSGSSSDFGSDPAVWHRQCHKIQEFLTLLNHFHDFSHLNQFKSEEKIAPILMKTFVRVQKVGCISSRMGKGASAEAASKNFPESGVL